MVIGSEIDKNHVSFRQQLFWGAYFLSETPCVNDFEMKKVETGNLHISSAYGLVVKELVNELHGLCYLPPIVRAS